MRTPGQLRLFILCACLAVTASASAQASTWFDTGVLAYNSGNYQSAADALSRAARDEPNNPYIHYFLANSYGKLGRAAEAVSHYEQARRLSKNPQLEEYCNVALNHYDSIELSRQHRAQAVADAERSAQRMAASLRALQNQRSSDAELLAARLVSEAQATILRINRMVDQEVEELQAMRGNRNFWEAIILEHRRMAARHTQHLNYTAGRSTYAARQSAQEQMKELRESAANLTQQMVGPRSRSGYGLLPYGTNLHVRNYGGGN